jgi:hypothetical protein
MLSDSPLVPRARMRLASTAARLAGSVALFAIAAVHLYELWVDHYSAIPTIGTLFALNGAGAIALGLLLAAPLAVWLGERRARLVFVPAALAGISLAAGTLLGLLISEHTPLLGFMEVGYRPVVVVSIVAEGCAMVVLSLFVMLETRYYAT